MIFLSGPADDVTVQIHGTPNGTAQLHKTGNIKFFQYREPSGNLPRKEKKHMGNPGSRWHKSADAHLGFIYFSDRMLTETFLRGVFFPLYGRKATIQTSGIQEQGIQEVLPAQESKIAAYLQSIIEHLTFYFLACFNSQLLSMVLTILGNKKH